MICSKRCSPRDEKAPKNSTRVRQRVSLPSNPYKHRRACAPTELLTIRAAGGAGAHPCSPPRRSRTCRHRPAAIRAPIRARPTHGPFAVRRRQPARHERARGGRRRVASPQLPRPL
eukprot:2057590-Pyramimonas_sp.AAC.2